MSTTLKPLINAQFGVAAGSTLYTAPAAKTTIIDKFTATNTDVAARTLSVSIVASAGVQSAANRVVYQKSIAAGVTDDLTELQNHILATGDSIYVVPEVDSKIVIRASGREVS